VAWEPWQRGGPPAARGFEARRRRHEPKPESIRARSWWSASMPIVPRAMMRRPFSRSTTARSGRGRSRSSKGCGASAIRSNCAPMCSRCGSRWHGTSPARVRSTSSWRAADWSTSNSWSTICNCATGSRWSRDSAQRSAGCAMRVCCPIRCARRTACSPGSWLRRGCLPPMHRSPRRPRARRLPRLAAQAIGKT